MKKTLLVLLFLFSSEVMAKDFGVLGTIYEIRERDFLLEIQEKLEAAKKDGRLDKFQNTVKDNMMKSIERPKELSQITKAHNSRSWLFDPSISLDHDLRDQNGRVFYLANTKVNPLEKISLSKTLIFIDGDDEEQVKFALQKNKERGHKTRIILVKGPIIKLMKKHKIRFYFDQNSKLTNKFQIKYVPATVEQEGKNLKISEVAL